MEKAQPQLASLTTESNHSDLYGYVSGVLRRHILVELLIVSWIIFLWELYLDFRQHRLAQKLVEPPKVLDKLMKADIYKKARRRFLKNSTHNIPTIVKRVYWQVLNTIFMTCGGFYFAWLWGKYIVKYVGLNPEKEIYVTTGCITIMIICLTVLYYLPLKIYDTLALKLGHKNLKKLTPLLFNKARIMEFLKNKAILYLLCVHAMPWREYDVIVMRYNIDINYLSATSFITFISLQLLFCCIDTQLINHLFGSKYKPLPKGDLKNCTEALASSLNFPINNIYIYESSYSNAYMRGFYKSKKIILSEALVAECLKKTIKGEENAKTESKDSSKDIGKEKKEVDRMQKESQDCGIDQVVAVVAHELGHWHLNHIIADYVSVHIAGLCLVILSIKLMHYAPIYEAFGFTDSMPLIIGSIVVVMYFLEPLFKLLMCARMMIHHRFEFQADRYAANLGYGKASQRALVRPDSLNNVLFPIEDKLYSNWHTTHPSVLERLDAIEKVVLV